MNTQNILKTALLLTIVAMATACSKGGSESSSEQASRASGTSVESGLYTECNQKAQGGVSVSLMNYKNSDGTYRDDYMKIKFLQVPSSFSQNGSYFQLFRWKATGSEQPSVDSTPVNARFETLDGKQILTNFAPTISWTQISAIAARSNMDQNTFFASVRLVVDIRDVNAEYDVLKVAYYNSSNQVETNMDMLLPAFRVTPSEYAIDGINQRSPTLMALHPFVNTPNRTPDQYLALAKSFCFQ